MKIAYLCLQETRSGQAAHAHVNEIIKGLRDLECKVDLYSVGSLNISNKINRQITRIFKILWSQINLIANIRKYQVVYIRMNILSHPLILACIILKKPYFVEANGPVGEFFMVRPYLKPFKNVIDRLMQIQISHSAGVISVTDQLTEYYKVNYGSKQSITIPNGANTDIFKPSDHSDKQEEYVLFFGALATWQGIENIIDAVNDANWPPNIKLFIAGRGVLERRVQLASIENPSIMYLGTIDYENMPNLISGALATLSVQNNLNDRSSTGLSPLKVYESLSCGVPVIATKQPFLRNIIEEEGLGVLVDGNGRSIADAVRYIFNNKDTFKQIGLDGRTLIESKHSWRARSYDTLVFIRSSINE